MSPQIIHATLPQEGEQQALNIHYETGKGTCSCCDELPRLKSKVEILDSELIGIAQRALYRTCQLPNRDRIPTSKSNVNEVIKCGVGSCDVVLKCSSVRISYQISGNRGVGNVKINA